jgi:hypothetical protein
MRKNCELEHTRQTKAVIRVIVKSTHADRPGRPMIREHYLCRAHANELRDLGFEVVGN